MASLTESKLERARDILGRYNQEMTTKRNYNTSALEKELKDRWGVSYQEIKGIMIDLLKKEEFKLLAVRYMEDGFPGVPMEFKIPLAKVYGMKYFDSPERDEMREKFWREAFQ